MTDKNNTTNHKLTYIKDLTETKNFCVLPFVNLNTNANGKLKLCCNIQIDRHVTWGEEDNYTEFNLGHDDINDIWNSRYLADVRYKMLKDQGVTDCEICRSSEEKTQFSPRIGQNQKLVDTLEHDLEFLDEVYDNITKFRTRDHLGNKPYSYELRLGNQCNLKCNSCWSVSSSQIYLERKDMVDDPKLPAFLKHGYQSEINQVENDDKRWYETDVFFENFKQSASTLKRLYTTGGEPTLIKSNYKILEILEEAHNLDCKIEFTTNMTTFNPEFYGRLEKFSTVESQVSIDGIGDHSEYIRYPTDWNAVDRNFSRLLELSRQKSKWNIVVYTVYQALNYNHVHEIWQYLCKKSQEFQVRISWWPIPLGFPDYLSLSTVPLEARTNYLNFLNSTDHYEDHEYFTVSKSAKNVVNSSLLNTPHNIALSERFNQWKNYYDSYRGMDSTKLINWIK
jgi:organic radical activating enzyme